MMKNKTKNLHKFFAVFFAFFMVFSLMMTPVFAEPTEEETSTEESSNSSGDNQKDNQKDNDVSFYKIASAAATYYEELHNEKSNDSLVEKKIANPLSRITMNNASSLMGFKDEDYDSWIIGATISKLSSSAQGRGYNAPENGVRGYLIYGNALSQLGLDKTSNANFNAISSIGRFIFGGIFYIFYMLAAAADFILEGCLRILMLFNPFSLFMGKGGITSKVGQIDGYDGKAMLGLSGFQKVLTDFYVACQDFAWIIIPLMLVWLLWGFLMRPGARDETGGDKNRSNLKKYIKRVAFIGLGVPVLASALAVSYGWFETMKDTQGVNPNSVVAMTFMDFETWARKTRLGLPSDVTIEVDTSVTPSGTLTKNTTNPTQIASKLNTHIQPSVSSRSQFEHNNTFFASVGNQADGDTGSWGFDRLREAEMATDLVGRFMSGSWYHATSFESDVKTTGKTLTAKEVERLGDRSKWHGGEVKIQEFGTDIVNDGSKNYLKLDVAGNRWIFTGGVQSMAGGSSEEAEVEKDSSGGIISSAIYKLFSYFGDGTIAGADGGLSTLGMYNYLNTTFTPSSVVVYSANKLSSIIVRDAHRSVSLVGEGIMSTFNYLNGLSLMMFMAVIGIGYGLGMLIGNLRRSIRLIMAIPLGVLGSLKMMARLTTIVVMMIAEIVGTILSYMIVLNFVYGVNVAIVETFNDIFSKLTFQATIGLPTVNGVMAPLLLGTLVAILFNLWFMVMALRVRKSMIKAIDEWLAGVVEKFFMAPGAAQREVAKGTQPSALKQAAQAAGTGAALSYGAGKMSDMLNKDKSLDGKVSGVSGGAENQGSRVQNVDAGSSVEGADRQVTGSDNIKDVSEEEQDAKRGQLMLASGATSLGGVNASDDIKNVDGKQAESDSKVQAITGQTGALEEEKDKERAKEIRKNAKAEQKEAAVKAVAGAVQTYVGAKTGNATMTADGVRKVQGSVEDGMKAKNEEKNAEGVVAKERLQENKAKKTVSGQKAEAVKKEQNKSVSNQMAQEKAKSQANKERKNAVKKAVVDETKDVGKSAVGAKMGGTSAGGVKTVSTNTTVGRTGVKSTQGVDASTGGLKTASTNTTVGRTGVKSTQGVDASTGGLKTASTNTTVGRTGVKSTQGTDASAKEKKSIKTVSSSGSTNKSVQTSTRPSIRNESEPTRTNASSSNRNENKFVNRGTGNANRSVQTGRTTSVGNTSMRNTNVMNQQGSQFISNSKSANGQSQRDFQASVREQQRQMAGQIAKMRRERNTAQVAKEKEIVREHVKQETRSAIDRRNKQEFFARKNEREDEEDS